MAVGRRIERLGLPFAGVVLLAVSAGSIAAAAPPRPNLVVTTVVVGRATVQAGESFRVSDEVRNRGPVPAPRSTTGYYLSLDRSRGPGDLRLGRRAVARLAPQASSRSSGTVAVPVTAAPGAYRLLACADDLGRVRESDETDNCRSTAHTIEVSGRDLGDRTPPTFEGLESATTCIPGPVGGGTSARYRLIWKAATDDRTPSSEIVYDVYQATKAGAENFSGATSTTAQGVTSYTTAPVPSNEAVYFVVRARDRAGNRDSNKTERTGVNLCE